MTERLEGTTISDALKLELLLTKDLQGPGLGEHTLIFIGCTTHHENLTTGFLAENHPKSIYNMPTFDVCKKSCKFICGQGAACKMHCNHFGKSSDDQIIITMQILGQNYPKFIYGMAHFEFGLNLQNRNLIRGVKLQIG